MTDRLMPDFTGALERHLRQSASAPAASPAREVVAQRRRRTPRFALAGFGCAAAAAAVVVALAGGDTGPAPAYGRPPVLRTPIAANAAEVLANLNAGQVVNGIFSPNGRMTEVRAVPAFGGTAYFATGAEGWCLKMLSPPAQQTADPLNTGSVTCRQLKDVYAYGIALADDGNIIAAVPENATHPTLTAQDGTSQTLTPSSQGVVTAQASTDSVLKLYGADGSTLALRVVGGSGGRP